MKLFIYCAGGFGREVFDTAARQNSARPQWEAIYFLDDGIDSGSKFYGTTVYDLKTAVTKFDPASMEVVIANGEPAIRELLFKKVVSHGLRLTTVIDPSAIISPTAKLADGVVVTGFCIVASQAVLGHNVILNVQSIVGHDIRIGAHSVLSSMVNVGGASTLGLRCYIGMGVQIIQGVSIGCDVIVGMGSVVHASLPDEIIALGNPARPMRRNVDKRVFKKP